MGVPEAVQEWLGKTGEGRVTSEQPVSGGCISNGRRIGTESGRSFFLKTNSHAPAGMFECEAEGLAFLRKPGGPRVPQTFFWGPEFLLMEDLAPAGRSANYWPKFGRQLAALHIQTGPLFGGLPDNYIGSTPQPNESHADGFVFFGELRLVNQAELAGGNGLLSSRDVGRVKQIAARLPEWIPDQAPAPLHGDLWAGNMISDSDGQPAMIDPAAHYGWPEADLAMTALFGRPPDSFYQAYWEINPLPAGFWERAGLYNLYHLLNHLNLFGRTYYRQGLRIINMFS